MTSNTPRDRSGLPGLAGGAGRLAALVVPAAALVAGALLALRLHFQPPTVPPYTLAAAGEVTMLRHGGHFELDAHPTAEVTGAVAAKAFLVRGDDVRRWDAPFEVSRDGSVHIIGPVDALFAGVPPGDWEIYVVIGRPETLPTAPKDVLRARDVDAGMAAWHLVRERILLGG